LRALGLECSFFASNLFSRSLTLGGWLVGILLRAGVDFAELRPILPSKGDEADRYDGLAFLAGIEGCFGVVPFPFDLNEEGCGRESAAIAAIPFVLSV
jgi:hypothetical protein